MNIKISDEQLNVINNLKDNNVIVESVAGSGKTTTILYINEFYSNKKILVLTYNSRLRLETKRKIKNNNIEVHTFHSFCVKYYHKSCINDSKMLLLIDKHIKSWSEFRYDIIILDEIQDLTPLYYRIVCKIAKDNVNNFKLCLLGDKRQNIYTFNKSDIRFMTYVDDFFDFNDYKWSKCSLNISYRITKEMSDFINNCVLKTPNYIISNKIYNKKPLYVICDVFDRSKDSVVFKKLKRYLNNGYKPEDIFILAPSIRKNKNDTSPVKILENLIKIYMPEISIYIPNTDIEKLDEKIIQNKLIFSTYHQVKGLERKIIIIYNFDNSYDIFYNSNNNDNNNISLRKTCPNELYVALTRSLEELVMLHHYQHDYLQFLDKHTVSTYCNIEIYNKFNTSLNKNCSEKIIMRDYDILSLSRYIPGDLINHCISFINIDIKDNHHKLIINIDEKIQTNDQEFEYVSEINLTTILINYELFLTNNTTNTIQNILFDYNIIKSITDNNKNDINYMVKLAIMYWSYITGFLFKKKQIKKYNWITSELLHNTIQNLSSLNLSVNAKFFTNFKINDLKIISPALNGISLSTIIDCIDNNNIYLFKCLKQFNDIYYIHMILNIFLYEFFVIIKQHKHISEHTINNHIITNNYYIYNIYNDELIEIKIKFKDIVNIIIKLIKYKENYGNIKDDSKYREYIYKIYNEYFI